MRKEVKENLIVIGFVLAAIGVFFTSVHFASKTTEKIIQEIKPAEKMDVIKICKPTEHHFVLGETRFVSHAYPRDMTILDQFLYCTKCGLRRNMRS